MIKSFAILVAVVGSYYVQQEGLPQPELVGERRLEEQANAVNVCSTAYAQNYYASQGIAPATASATFAPKGRGYSVQWAPGTIDRAPAVAVDCYVVGESVVHLAVNGEDIVSYPI